MNSDKILELAFYTLPALITGGVAYYLFQSYFNDQQNTRRWLVQKENQKQSLPLRLQAYERLALFLERINAAKLLIRVPPLSDDKNDYERLLIQHIEQEYEHNLTQQVYVSDECWTIIITAKNTIIQNIMKTNLSEKVDSAQKLRETILNDLLDSQSPSTIALSFLKNEVKGIL
jgi:RNase H-fold protein (predicted Holliday junction resolvase)